MPHATGIQRPEGDDLVTLSFSVPSDQVTPGANGVFIRIGKGRGIRVPKTLVAETGKSGYVVFEAQVPGDVAATVISLCAQLFQQAQTEKEA